MLSLGIPVSEVQQARAAIMQISTLHFTLQSDHSGQCSVSEVQQARTAIMQISTLHYTAQFRNSPFQQPTDTAGLVFTHFAQDSHIGTTQWQCHWLLPSL